MMSFHESIMNILKYRLKSLHGLLLAFFSAIFFSVTTVIVKQLEDIHPGQMATIRFVGIFLFTLPVLIESGKHPFGSVTTTSKDLTNHATENPSKAPLIAPPSLRAIRFYLLLRGICGASSLYFRYAALRFLPIGDATVIVLSMPVFVCIFGRIFLKEPCGIFHVVALVITIIGIGFTSKWNVIFGSDASADEEEKSRAAVDASNQMLGFLCGMGATLVGSSAYVIVRKLRDLHHSVILFNFSWVAIIEISFITYLLDGFKLPECGLDPWLLTILAILSFYGQFLLTKALQSEEAGLVSVTRASSEVIFAFIFQITIFGQMPDLWSMLGATLVTTSVLLITMRKYILNLPKESKVRHVLSFITK